MRPVIQEVRGRVGHGEGVERKKRFATEEEEARFAERAERGKRRRLEEERNAYRGVRERRYLAELGSIGDQLDAIYEQLFRADGDKATPQLRRLLEARAKIKSEVPRSS